MIKKFLFSLTLVVFWGPPILAQETELEDDAVSTDNSDPSEVNAESEAAEEGTAEEKQAAINAAEQERHEKADAKAIYPLFKDILQLSDSTSESTLNKTKQERKLASLMKSLNEANRGKILIIERAVVQDVKPETRLTKVGERKIKAAKKKLMNSKEMRQARAIYGDEFMNNPLFAMMLWPLLGSCKNCTEETGRFNAEYRVEITIPASKREDNSENSNDMLQIKIVTVIETEKKAARLKPHTTVKLRGAIAGLEYDKYTGGTIYLFEE